MEYAIGPIPVREAILAALSPNAADRPSLDELITAFCSGLDETSARAGELTRFYVHYHDTQTQSAPEASWPYLEARLRAIEEAFDSHHTDE